MKALIAALAVALSASAFAGTAEKATTSAPVSAAAQDTKATRTAVARKIVALTVDAPSIKKELDAAIAELPFIQRTAAGAALKKLTPSVIADIHVAALVNQFTTKELDVLLMSETHKAELLSVPKKLEAYNNSVNTVFKEELTKALTAAGQ